MSQPRVPFGVPTGGQYATGGRAESTPNLIADRPCTSCVGAGGVGGEPCWDCQSTGLHNGGHEHPEHHLAHLGISTVTLHDGTVVAHNANGAQLPCPVCLGDLARQANCSECAGRGKIQNVPYCDRPWDEIVPGLYLGGHDNQPAGGDARVRDQFDVVVSLYSRDGYGPDPGIPHHTHAMIDGDLAPRDHAHVHRLADAAVTAMNRDQQVLVRCQAGMNRSGLVAGLALIKTGWRAADAIEHMRAVRGPYVLFNTSFTDYLHDQDTRIHRLR